MSFKNPSKCDAMETKICKNFKKERAENSSTVEDFEMLKISKSRSDKKVGYQRVNNQNCYYYTKTDCIFFFFTLG